MRNFRFALFAVVLAALQVSAQVSLPLTGVGRTASGGGSATVTAATPCAASGATSCNVTFSVAVAAGHRVAVWELSTGSLNTPTMTGETFTAFTGTSGCLDNTGDVLQCWVIQSAVGGQTSITCSTAGTTNIMCAAFDISDPQNLATPKDAGGHGNNAGATSFSVSTSAATTVSSDVVIACFGSDGAAISNPFAAVGPYSQLVNFTEASGTGVMMCEDNFPGSTGTQTAQATLGTSARASYSLLAIKP